MAELFDCPPSPALVEKARTAMPAAELAERLNLGPATLADILNALAKPGRDPRDDLPQPLLSHDLLELEDLEPGMELEGTVTNIAAFGAFVDIGLHENGLGAHFQAFRSFCQGSADRRSRRSDRARQGSGCGQNSAAASAYP